jgi:hypothetical protein
MLIYGRLFFKKYNCIVYLMRDQEIMSTIGNKVNQTITDEWINAYIDVDFSEPGTATVNCRYFKVNDSDEYSFDIPQVYLLFMELREIIKKDDDNKWKRARFNMKKTGEFNMDFTY